MPDGAQQSEKISGMNYAEFKKEAGKMDRLMNLLAAAEYYFFYFSFSFYGYGYFCCRKFQRSFEPVLA